MTMTSLTPENTTGGSTPMRFGEAICKTLAARGADTVFGIPGVHTLELFRNLQQHGMRVVVPRHEQGAGFMADAYARVTGHPGVCFLVTGPGVLNALTAVAQAWHDSIPMLVIASTVETAQVGQHQGTLHDTPDIADTMRPYTLLSRNVSTLDEFRAAIDEAYSRWATERPRPVYIGVPLDVLGQTVDYVDPGQPARPPAPTALAPEQLDRVVAALHAATTPVIVAGGGCRGAADELLAVAEALDAPVVLTTNSKGLLPDAHPLNVNLSTPFAGTRHLLETADAVLAVGTELSDFEYIPTGSTPATLRNIIRVDLDPTASHPDQGGATLVSDAKQFLADLLPRISTAEGSGDRPRPLGGAERAAAARASWTQAYADDPYRDWVEALRLGIPEDAILALDSAQLAYQAHQFMELPKGATWLSPYGFGTLGPAIPMAVGAAVASEHRSVIALAGDGSSLFTIAELATAADLGRQLTVVLWINGGYREIEASFERAEIPAVGVATSAPDFAAIATGLGATTVVVREPGALTEALRSAVNSPKLTVVLVAAPEPLCVNSNS